MLDPISSNSDERRIQNREFRRLSAMEMKSGRTRTKIEATVEALVCTECGYFEEYVKNPKDLDWEQLPLFQWLGSRR
ncbi:MAG: hypothetical protein KDA28_13905 [Phycisphaerales bacterium]|nr:hypothetical protein [Phycisphaerales bacterium]